MELSHRLSTAALLHVPQKFTPKDWGIIQSNGGWDLENYSGCRKLSEIWPLLKVSFAASVIHNASDAIESTYWSDVYCPSFCSDIC